MLVAVGLPVALTKTMSMKRILIINELNLLIHLLFALDSEKASSNIDTLYERNAL